MEGLGQNVLKMNMEYYDLDLYDKCTVDYFKHEEEAKKKQEAISQRWSQVEEIAQENARRRMIILQVKFEVREEMKWDPVLRLWK